MPTSPSSSAARSRAARRLIAEVSAHRLLQLRADGAHRVQRRHRVLEDHRDVLAAQPLELAAGHAQHVDAVELDVAVDARAVGQQSHERQRGDALARAGLADHAEHLAGSDVEADAVDGLQRAARGRECDPQVAHRQQRPAPVGAHGMASPLRRGQRRPAACRPESAGTAGPRRRRQRRPEPAAQASPK